MEEWNGLIIKYLTGECTAREREDLEQWLRQDSQNDTYFRKLKKLWERGEIRTDNFNPDLQKALIRIHEKIKSGESVKVIQMKPDLLFYAKRIAAVLIAGMCIGLATYYLISQEIVQPLSEFKTGDEKKELLLPDGTKVWMNKNSSLTYPEKFEKDIREITLEGEAYLDVAKDQTKPFIIHSYNAVIRVVGTSFNVRALAKEDNVLVTVTSGKVAFYNESDETGVVYLAKGDKGVLTKYNGLIAKETNTDINFLSWQTRQLLFNDTPMEEAVRALSRHYDKSIVVDSDVTHCRFTSTFENQSLQEVLDEFKILLNVEIQNKNNTITLTGKGCPALE